MAFVIALAGKGGTGKTTIAALIVRLLKEKKAGSVLAVDADPNSNLHEALGVPLAHTIGQILDEVAQHPEKVPAGMPKDRFLEYEVQTAIAEGEGFDLLSMGRPEGPGCYCYVNNCLRNIMAKLIKDYDFVVIDNEAGLEHLSRRTTRSADRLVLVSDPTIVGLKAAKRIYELAEELKIERGKDLLVLNRADKRTAAEKFGGDIWEIIGPVPDDPEIERICLNGDSLMGLKDDALSLNALRRSGDKIWQSQ